MTVTVVADVAGAIPAYIQLQVESTFPDKLFMPWLVTRDFSGDLAKDGDRVAINAYAAASAQDAAGGFTPEALSESTVTVIMDQWKVGSFSIDDEARLKSIHDWKKAITQRCLEPIANAFEDALLGQYTNMTTNNYSATGTNGGLKWDDLVKIRRLLVAQNAVPNANGNYNLVLSAFDMQELMLLQKFIDASYTGDGGMAIQQGFVTSQGGFDIYSSNRIPSSGTTVVTYHSMAFGASAFGLVTRAPDKPLGAGLADVTMVTDPRTGITMRVVISFDHTGGFVNTVSVDLFYGTKTMNEAHAVDISSAETV